MLSFVIGLKKADNTKRALQFRNQSSRLPLCAIGNLTGTLGGGPDCIHI